MKQIKAVADSVKQFEVAIVVSRFNEDITTALKQGALERLAEHGFDSDKITIVEVPGAIEIPLVAKKLAMQNTYGAIIALGAVIRGETTHYEYVCQQVSYGCQEVALRYDVPVVFGVLTTENEMQAKERVGGRHGHKGADAVDCALSMYSILEQMS